MHAYLKPDTSEFDLKGKKNELERINNDLASAREMIDELGQTRRKKLRTELIKSYNEKYPDSPYKLTHRKIRSLECLNRCKVPVNIIEILRVIIKDIQDNKEQIRYRADSKNKDKVSEYMVKYSLAILRKMQTHYNAHPDLLDEHYNKYRKDVEDIVKKLEKLNEDYPGNFNSLFEE